MAKKMKAATVIALLAYLILPALALFITWPSLEAAMAARAAHGLPVGQFPPAWVLLLALYAASAPYLLIVFRPADSGWVFLALKQAALWLAARFHTAHRAGRERGREGPSDGV